LIGWIAFKNDDSVLLRTYDLKLIKCRVTSGAVKLLELPLETLVEVKGVYRSEFYVNSYRVIHVPIEEREVNYIDTYIEPLKFALNYTWYFRNPVYAKTILLQHYILHYSRDFLIRNGFVELLPPVISPSSDPGLRGARKLKTVMYGYEYELTSSVIMYKQLSVAVYPRVFFIARNVREEPVDNAHTGRHLSEFTQLDIEVALANIDDVIELAEKLLYYVTNTIADKHGDLVVDIGCRREPVVLKPPFKRITYDEALGILSDLGYRVEWGRELSFEAEKAIADYFSEPVWVTCFPRVSRGFYYYPKPDDPRYNMDFNLILPEGYGEIIDGGMREYRYSNLLNRIKEMGENTDRYQWFLNLARKGAIPPSAGWGLGVERFTRFITGHKHVVYASFYPKLPGLPGTP